MSRCCVHHIAGYPPCGELAAEQVTLTTETARLTVALCQEHLDYIEQGLRETGCIPMPAQEE